MSETDVERLRSALQALGEQGYEALLPQVHPEFEMDTPPGLAAEPQSYRGRDGMRRWWESFYEVMDEVRFEPLHLHAGSEGRVAVEFRLVARGQASGIETTQESFAVVQMENELLRRFDFYASLDEALAAARS